jgi:hypothetical protein
VQQLADAREDKRNQAQRTKAARSAKGENHE